MTKGARGGRGFLSEIGLGVSQTLAGKSSGGGIQDQLRRTMSQPSRTGSTSTAGPATFDWTFDIIEVGTGLSWESAVVDLAAGGWVISINLSIVALTGGTIEGIRPYIGVEDRPGFEGSGASLTRSIRTPSSAQCVVGYLTDSGIDFTATVYASFTKVYDL
jgi:hypothetical protein